MATHLGLGKAIRVMRNEITRSSLDKLRKESLVDMIVSLAFTTRAIPGVQGHLETAHALSCTSPSNGGGMEAVIRQLKDVCPNPTEATVYSPGGNVDTESGTAEVDGGNGVDHQEIIGSGNAPALRKSMCQCLWKGKDCEDPESCDRAQRLLCLEEACKSSRNPDCHNWHYRPKKQKSSANGSAPVSRNLGNTIRGRTAPRSKSANSNSKRHLSQATERKYLKWRLSKMELEQSKMAAATYGDILVSRPAVPSSQPQPRGPSVAISALVHCHAAQ